MAEIKFSKEHEWIKVEGDTGIVGISDYAQHQLGDVVFVDLPAVGKSIKQFDEVAVVESVKAASEIYAPVGGDVIEVNNVLSDNPQEVNSSPMENGWFLKIKIANTDDLNNLMSADEYKNYIEGLG